MAEGSVACEGEHFAAPAMVTFAADEPANLALAGATRGIWLGGPALATPPHIWWNFVASDLARIEQAKDDWLAGRFPSVPGESTPTPLPGGPTRPPF